MGLEARCHRVLAGARLACDGAVQRLAGAVRHLSDRDWLIDGAGAGRLGGVPAAALAGWLFGFGYFVPGLYWIGNAFLVDAQTFAWLMPFAVIGLPAYLALFTALGFALARLIWTKDASRILALAAALTVGEWLRGHVLTGFPWNAFGYALTEPLALAQTASLIGLWGLTFLSVAIFASPAVLIDGRSRSRRPWIAPVIAGHAARRHGRLWRSRLSRIRRNSQTTSNCASCSPIWRRTRGSTIPPKRR